MRRKNSACGHSMRNLNLKLVNMDGGSGVGLIIAHMSIMSTLRIVSGMSTCSRRLGGFFTRDFIHTGFSILPRQHGWREGEDVPKVYPPVVSPSFLCHFLPLSPPRPSCPPILFPFPIPSPSPFIPHRLIRMVMVGGGGGASAMVAASVDAGMQPAIPSICSSQDGWGELCHQFRVMC